MARWRLKSRILSVVAAAAIIAGGVALLMYERGHRAESNYIRGISYLKGENGLAIDSVQAIRYLRAAADEGHPGAMTAIGEIYFHGWGVQRDEATANQWFQRGADAGDPRAMTILGCLNSGIWSTPHREGETYELKRDDVAAFSWFQRAADKGDPTAMANLSRMYLTGEGTQRDPVKARQWAQRAAAEGNRDGNLVPMQFP